MKDFEKALLIEDVEVRIVPSIRKYLIRINEHPKMQTLLSNGYDECEYVVRHFDEEHTKTKGEHSKQESYLHLAFSKDIQDELGMLTQGYNPLLCLPRMKEINMNEFDIGWFRNPNHFNLFYYRYGLEATHEFDTQASEHDAWWGGLTDCLMQIPR